ncbi:MAG: hypothetical protein RL757_41 [Bacteroidota bacterium]|jgi:probable phosphoglycerate mutase
MTLYLIRHGETEQNRLGIAQGSGIDSDLNDIGKKQAHFFYQYYHRIKFDYVITSALKRTQQTVQRFLNPQKSVVQHLDALNEISWGVHEGKKSDERSKKDYLAVMEAWLSGDASAKIEDGESIGEVAKRLEPFVEFLKTVDAQNLLVCTHGRTMLCLLVMLQNEPIENMQNYKHANTGLYILHRIGEDFHIEVQNSTQHLFKKKIE